MLEHPKFDRAIQGINDIEELEQESVIILKRGILAGYSTSYYGLGWKPKEEVKFWETVYSKAPQSGVAILTLAESYTANGIKTFEEVVPMYFQAIELNPEHYYSLMDGDVAYLRKDAELKFKFTDIEIGVYETMWDIEDFKEEITHNDQRSEGDADLAAYRLRKIEEVIARKMGGSY